MLKKSLLSVTALMILGSFASCKSGMDSMDLEQPAQEAVQQSDEVQVSSISGIWKEIKTANKSGFAELDKDANKTIEPSEYGVGTSDEAKSFYALDSNHDGKLTEKEFSENFFKRAGLTLRLRAAARDLFKVLDKNKNGRITKDELVSPVVSAEFAADFDKYDKESGMWFWKNNKGELNKTEFENLFAEVAMKKLAPPAPPAPAPAPSAAPAKK
ncbi:MAG: EF-hand domain-containing protein [Candidatus Sericytochromatia bacterium]